MYTRQTYYQPSTITIAYDAHGTLGGVASEMRKEGSSWSGFASGAVASFMTTTAGVLTQNLSEAWQVTCMVATGGLSGGVSSSMAGGDFWDGVCNGLICSGLNHAMHIVVGPDDPPSPAELKEHIKELVKAKISFNIAFSSKILFDEKSGQWMGKNFKFYSMKWGGNQYTGGKLKFAKTTRNILKGTGYAISAIEGAITINNYAQGDITFSEMAREIGFNVGTTLSGDIGAAISVGRALSNLIIYSNWYQDFKFDLNYYMMENKIGVPCQNNQTLWMDFINNYK
ncbi:MAG: hypothetical protein IJ622_07340 [Bacteroidales bacterium]|nr:hypothetical protein [Bacteroidales bacterium]